MKKKLIILLMINLHINAQTTLISDSNFELYLIEEGLDDIVDGSVLTSNINVVTVIDINGRNISNLTGVGDFTMLENLQCYMNPIDVIDVSQNENLLEIDFSETNITTIDLSGNLLLERLRFNNTLVTNIDVSNNINLEELICYDSQLNTLNIENNIELTLLNCFSNNLAELDLSNHPNLVFVWVSNNQLEHLKIKNGNNSNIVDFDATNNSNLTCIYVDDKDASYLTNWEIDTTSNFVETDVECEAISVNSMPLSLDFSLHPNPAKNKVIINSNNPIKTIYLYDITGKFIAKYNETIINLKPNFKSGLYFIKVVSEERIGVKKLIIE